MFLADWNSFPPNCNQIQWKHGKLSVAKPGRHCLGQIIKVSITSGAGGSPRVPWMWCAENTASFFFYSYQECMVFGHGAALNVLSPFRMKGLKLKLWRTWETKNCSGGIVPDWRKLIRLDNEVEYMLVGRILDWEGKGGFVRTAGEIWLACGSGCTISVLNFWLEGFVWWLCLGEGPYLWDAYMY